MPINPRNYIENDKWMPTSLAGDGHKILAVKADASGYEHVPPSAELTGQVIMWMFDTPPAGFLPVGATYNYDDYPALGALFGATTGQTFDVPAINFAKGSNGVNTGQIEVESVGTHGHSIGSHIHDINVTSEGAHTHVSSARSTVGATAKGSATNEVAKSGTETGAAGAHTHLASSLPATGSVVNHTGVNQPGCTLINFVIRT